MPSFRLGSSREAAIKSSITSNLIESVKEVQVKYANAGGTLVSDETTNDLCTVIEAVFVHGLKDTFVKRVTNVFGTDINRVPEPDFWSFLLVFSHKDIIENLLQLSLISSDTGHSRAWIRMSLNDGLFCSYVDSMQKEKKALKDYYNKSAYLRDNEQLDILKNYMLGIEGYDFGLACNSSILNSWTSMPLTMAGLWVPTAPLISRGVEALEELDCDVSLIPTPNRARRPYRTPIVNEDEALRVILSSSSYIPQSNVQDIPNISKQCEVPPLLSSSVPSSDSASIASDRSDQERRTGIRVKGRQVDITESDAPPLPPVVLESLVPPIEKVEVANMSEEISNVRDNSGVPGASCIPHEPNTSNRDDTNPTNVNFEGLSTSPVMDNGISEPYDDGMRRGNSLTYKRGWSSGDNPDSDNYLTVLTAYSMSGASLVKTPDSNQVVCDKYQEEDGMDKKPESPLSPLEGFEEFPESQELLLNKISNHPMMPFLLHISNEKGLDQQNYECVDCRRPIGMIYGKPRMCWYTGAYYCCDCHDNQEIEIPARILHNWDFRRYPVCRRANRFLTQIENDPLLDVLTVSPNLYRVIEEMGEVQVLRTQLNYLRAYLFTCRQPIIQDLRKMVWPREYLCEHVHLYSINDFLNVPNRALNQGLTKVISFARNHVANCWLCSQKGFVCEVCSHPKVIYPFDLKSTYRCSVCTAVYHNSCLDTTKPCPKCKRRKLREDYDFA